MTEAGGSGASWSYGENGLTVKDNGAGWPNIAYSLETPLTVDVANATLSYKITNVNTAGNIAILITLSDTEVIVPHRLFTDEGIDFEAGTSKTNVSNRLKLFLAQARENFERGIAVDEPVPTAHRIIPITPSANIAVDASESPHKDRGGGQAAC